MPVLAFTGVATTTYSVHRCSLHAAVRRNWYPDLVHQAAPVQLAFASISLIKSACSGEGVPGRRGSGPSDAKSGAKPLLGYVPSYVICAVLMVRVLPTADASLAAIFDRNRFGIATAATIRTAATSNWPLWLASPIADSAPLTAMRPGTPSPDICERDCAI